MKEFNIEKKGYSIKEVDDYIIMQQIENDRLLKEKQSRINELREENFTLTRDLQVLKQREDSVSKALISSTEKAKEIEEKAKSEYSLELKNLDMFYKKWESFFNELIKRYPKMNDFDTDDVLLTLKSEINNLLNDSFQYSKPANKTDDFKSLIDRLHTHSNKKEVASLKINKKANKDIEFEDNDKLMETKKENNIKPITNLTISTEEKDEFENLLDKFLHSDNNISKGYKNSILNVGKKKVLKTYPKPNDSGFDLEQALNPTDSLSDIMKGFKLDD